MRGIYHYHRGLPSDFETNTVGTKNRYEDVIRKAVDELNAVLTAPVNTPQFARESIEDVVNGLRDALGSRQTPDDYYDDPADEDFLKMGRTT